MLRAPAILALALQVIGPFDPPPAPWALDLSQNVVRHVHRGPFEGRTTVWVRLLPKADDARVSPTTFVFVAEFAGKSPRARPPVTIQVGTDLRFYPLVPRVPRLHLAVDGREPIDLLASGPSSVSYCCDDSPFPTGATVTLSAELLDRLAEATSIAGDAFGVPFTVDRAQRAAVVEFRRTVVPDSR